MANVAQLDLDRNSQQLSTDVTRLSSGLRINSAADDPSGLAISQSLQSHVDAYDASSGDVQTATNALSVADGALATVESLLQRLRSLAVEASSDLSSAGDRDDLQVESAQLLLEINRIDTTTQFNGRPLFGLSAVSTSSTIVYGSGYFDDVQPEDYAGGAYRVGPEPAPTAGSVDIAAISSAVVGNAIVAPAGWTLLGSVATADTQLTLYDHVVTGTEPNNFQFTFPVVNAISAAFLLASGVNPADPVQAFALQASGGADPNDDTPTVMATADGTQAYAFFTEGTVSAETGTSTNPLFPTVDGVDFFRPTHPIAAEHTDAPLAAGTSVSTGLTAIDTDALSAIVLLNPIVTVTTPPAINVHDGAAEGDIVPLTISGVSTMQLGIADIDLTASSSSAIAGAQSAETALDGALTTLAAERAHIGAQIVALTDDASDDETAAVNERAAESSIADASIGQTVTDDTRLNILVQIGTSVLAQANADPKTILQLFR